MKFSISSLLFLSATATTSALPDGWETCGGLEPALNRTACPTATATCCTQKWAPGEGTWGCIDWKDATCCSNGYTACPSGTTCKDTGSGWGTVSECVPSADTGAVKGDSNSVVKVPTPTAGKQVCKQGAPNPFSTSLPNVRSTKRDDQRCRGRRRRRRCCTACDPPSERYTRGLCSYSDLLLVASCARAWFVQVLILGDSVSIGYTPYVAEVMAAEALVQHTPWGGDGGAEETA